MTKDELIEALAAIEHERWRKQQQRVHDTSFRIKEPIILPGDYRQTEPGALVIEAARAEYWQGMADTPYADLPEPYKQEIRDRIGESWSRFVEFVAGWLLSGDPESLEVRYTCQQLAQAWREDMA